MLGFRPSWSLPACVFVVKLLQGRCTSACETRTRHTLESLEERTWLYVDGKNHKDVRGESELPSVMVEVV